MPVLLAHAIFGVWLRARHIAYGLGGRPISAHIVAVTSVGQSHRIDRHHLTIRFGTQRVARDVRDLRDLRAVILVIEISKRFSRQSLVATRASLIVSVGISLSERLWVALNNVRKLRLLLVIRVQPKIIVVVAVLLRI